MRKTSVVDVKRQSSIWALPSFLVIFVNPRATSSFDRTNKFLWSSYSIVLTIYLFNLELRHHIPCLLHYKNILRRTVIRICFHNDVLSFNNNIKIDVIIFVRDLIFLLVCHRPIILSKYVGYYQNSMSRMNMAYQITGKDDVN